MNFRRGHTNDVEQLKALGLRSWSQYKDVLTEENWDALFVSLNSNNTYVELLEKSECFICQNDSEIIGMAFLVPSGNPSEIYDEEWCHLRFVSVDPNHRGKAIGKQLTKLCIEQAMRNNETIMALHTSEIMNSARHIYEQIGFKIIKELKPRLGVRYWLYTLNLNA